MLGFFSCFSTDVASYYNYRRFIICLIYYVFSIILEIHGDFWIFIDDFTMRSICINFF